MNYHKDAPPPYGMQLPPQQPPTLITQQIIVPNNFGPEPQTIVCPSCHTTVVTRVDRESTVKTHLVALLLCFIFCPIFWLPYCCDTCQAANHYCPKCGAYLGACDR